MDSCQRGGQEGFGRTRLSVAHCFHGNSLPPDVLIGAGPLFGKEGEKNVTALILGVLGKRRPLTTDALCNNASMKYEGRSVKYEGRSVNAE